MVDICDRKQRLQLSLPLFGCTCHDLDRAGCWFRFGLVGKEGIITHSEAKSDFRCVPCAACRQEHIRRPAQFGKVRPGPARFGHRGAAIQHHDIKRLRDNTGRKAKADHVTGALFTKAIAINNALHCSFGQTVHTPPRRIQLCILGDEHCKAAFVGCKSIKIDGVNRDICKGHM